MVSAFAFAFAVAANPGADRPCDTEWRAGSDQAGTARQSDAMSDSDSSAFAPALTLTGEVVEISYIADPEVGYGRFIFSNSGSSAVTVSIESAWLETGTGRQPIASIKVFDPAQEMDGEQPRDPHRLQVTPGATRKFGIGFGSIAYEPSFGESVAVGLRVRSGKIMLEARSPLRFIRRWPRSVL